MEKETITIDASNKAPGRVATEVATALMGKNRPDYQPHVNGTDRVEVQNVANMKLDRKYTNSLGYRFSKKYHRHSGYPGGLKTTLAKDLPPQEILYKAVFNMLPKNKLRKEMLKRLTIN